MTYEEENEKYEAIIKRYDGVNINRYCLVSNWGYTFEIDNKRYDARFIANCYGAVCNWWDCYTADGDKELASEIAKEFNK